MESYQYSDQEPLHLAARAIQDALFLKQGATYESNGRLEISAATLDGLHEKAALAKQEAFLKDTPEGRSILSHQKVIYDIDTYTSPGDWERLVSAGSADLPMNASLGIYLSRKLADDNISLELGEYCMNTESFHSQIRRKLKDMRRGLDETLSKLIDYPGIRIGKTVQVERGLKDSRGTYLESGWVIERITLNGKLRVVSPDQKIAKNVSLNSLLRNNDRYTV